MYKKIISLFFVFAIFISNFCLSALAEYSSVPLSLFDKLVLEYANHYDDWDIWSPFNDLVATVGTNTVCASSSDNLHHANSFLSSGHDDSGYYLNCQCTECGNTFQYYSSDLEAQYDSSIVASGFNGVSSASNGYLYMYINEFTHTLTDGNNVVSSNGYTYQSLDSGNDWRFYSQAVAPISGVYYYSNSNLASFNLSWIDSNGSILNDVTTNRTLSFRSGGIDSVYLNMADSSTRSFSLTLGSPFVLYSTRFTGYYFSMTATFRSPVIIRITPTGTVSTPINITNHITNVYSGNNTYNNIVNTNTNQYYDVGTDELIDILSWQFDYMNREYTLQLDRLTDSLVKVKFGLDNLTVEAGTTINNYYYGYDECDPSPSHTHTWTSTVVSERTCTIPGITTYACEECNQTYTDTVPAIGHIFDSGVHHDAVIDPETEDVITPGYTTYTCTVCGATQDVTDGSPPPSSAENSDVWWDKLLKWLADFKTDLFNKLDHLNISDNDTTNITIEGNDFTFNEGDDEDSFSFRNDFLAKFGVIKDLWDVGQYVVNIVSEDAANAYNFDINDALSIDSSGTEETTP